MIILFNPRSTRPRNRRLPLSVLALGAVFEGREEYEIVDGNLLADPVGRILEIGCGHKLSAVAFTVMPGPQLNHAVPDAQRLKAALPEIFTGMRIGIGVGWTTLVAAEMVAATHR